MKEYIYTQVGPMPSPKEEIVVADPKEYPKDTYGEYTSEPSFPWLWILFFICVIGVEY